MLLKTPPVRQPRQCIEIGDEIEVFLARPQRIFKLLTLGYIKSDGSVAVDLSALVQVRDDRCVDPIERAVLSAIAYLPMPDLSLSNFSIHRLEEGLVMHARAQHAVVRPQQLNLGVATDFTELAVDIGDRALDVGVNDDCGTV